MMSVMSSVGSPTDVNTITMVTRPAWGMPAAPMLAAVAVILEEDIFVRKKKLLELQKWFMEYTTKTLINDPEF